MRLLASGDHHFDETTRFDECVRIHEWMVQTARERKPDVFLSAGDVYERSSTPKERAAVADWLTATAEICEVIVVKGNHDRPQDCAFLGRLKSRHPIRVVETFDVVHLAVGDVAALAWPNKAMLAAESGRRGEALEQTTIEVLRAVLSDLAFNLEAGRPHVLLMHAMVNGSRTSLGQPLIGAELSIGLEDLTLARCDLALLGHIHAPQEWRGVGGADALYVGAPFRTAFGETEEKSVVWAELEHGKPARWERVVTPARRMLLIGGTFDGLEFVTSPQERALLDHGLPADSHGADVRFRYNVATEDRTTAKAAAVAVRARLTETGAALVKIEEIVAATVRARAPEIAAARTLAEKLQAFWAAKGMNLDADRRAALLGKITTLEDACASTG